MPQASTLTINDGASTPVAHLFTTVGVKDGIATFKNSSATTLSGREVLTVGLREGSATTPPKVSIKLTIPVERIVDGMTVVTHQYFGDINFVISPGSSAAERKAYFGLLANVADNAQVRQCVENVESFY